MVTDTIGRNIFNWPVIVAMIEPFLVMLCLSAEQLDGREENISMTVTERVEGGNGLNLNFCSFFQLRF